MRPLEIVVLVAVPWTLLVAGLWLATPTVSLRSITTKAAAYLLAFTAGWLAVVLVTGGSPRGLLFDIGWTFPWLAILAVRLAATLASQRSRPFRQVLGSAMAGVAVVVAVFMVLANLGALLVSMVSPG